MATPWSTIAEGENDGTLSYEMHVPFGEDPDACFVLVWDETAVREIHEQLEEFIKLVDQKRALEEIIAADSGGH